MAATKSRLLQDWAAIDTDKDSLYPRPGVVLNVLAIVVVSRLDNCHTGCSRLYSCL